MDEPPDLGGHRRVEQEPQCGDVQAAELLQGAPVADLGGAVEDPVDPLTAGAQGIGVFEVSGDLLDAELIEPAGVARRADQGPDAVAAGQGFLSDVAADQARGAGEENRLDRGHAHSNAHPGKTSASALRPSAFRAILKILGGGGGPVEGKRPGAGAGVGVGRAVPDARLLRVSGVAGCRRAL